MARTLGGWLIALLTIGCASDPVVVLTDFPEEVDFIAILTRNADGAPIDATGLISTSERIELTADPERADRIDVLGYNRATLAPLSPPSDAELRAAPVRLASMRPLLPPPDIHLVTGGEFDRFERSDEELELATDWLRPTCTPFTTESKSLGVSDIHMVLALPSGDVIFSTRDWEVYRFSPSRPEHPPEKLGVLPLIDLPYQGIALSEHTLAVSSRGITQPDRKVPAEIALIELEPELSVTTSTVGPEPGISGICDLGSSATSLDLLVVDWAAEVWRYRSADGYEHLAALHRNSNDGIQDGPAVSLGPGRAVIGSSFSDEALHFDQGSIEIRSLPSSAVGSAQGLRSLADVPGFGVLGGGLDGDLMRFEGGRWEFFLEAQGLSRQAITQIFPWREGFVFEQQRTLIEYEGQTYCMPFGVSRLGKPVLIGEALHWFGGDNGTDQRWTVLREADL